MLGLNFLINNNFSLDTKPSFAHAQSKNYSTDNITLKFFSQIKDCILTTFRNAFFYILVLFREDFSK